MLWKSSSLALAAAACWAVAEAAPQVPGEVLTGTVGNATIAGDGPKVGKDGKYTIYGTGIRANFVPYGASISNLFINDTSGCERDIVGGWDNATYYTLDKQHPHFGGVPGRYANRIKNSSFEIDGETYHILPNENPEPGSPQGVDTLHGGPDGWDWRNWTVVAHTTSSITFSITDPDGDQGFPGEVVSYVTYSLGNMTWDFKMVAVATEKKTPIMLSSHVSLIFIPGFLTSVSGFISSFLDIADISTVPSIPRPIDPIFPFFSRSIDQSIDQLNTNHSNISQTYWNLDGWANPNTPLALNHSLWLPYGGQRVDADPILIPTGDILANKQNSLNDFWSAPKQIGANFTNPDLLGNCGTNCTGYDTCYLTNRQEPYDWRVGTPVARLRSAWSGIQVDVHTDQEAFQVYSCGGQNGEFRIEFEVLRP